MNLSLTKNLVFALAAFAAAIVEAKKGKGGNLPEYDPEPAANFEGTFNLCYGSVIRNTAVTSGPGSNVVGTFHLCADDSETLGPFDGLFAVKFDRTNDLNAYEGEYQMPGNPNNPNTAGEEPLIMKFQGFAFENVIKMRSIGTGTTQGGTQVFENNTPDDLTCSIYRNQVIECFIQFTEYCEEGELLCDEREDGTWILSYAINFIYAAQTEYCPSAPEGFCSSNNIPLPPPNSSRRSRHRHLKISKDDDASACPFAAKGKRKA